MSQVQTGRFVVRESQSERGEHTLSVLVNGRVRHIRVRKLGSRGVALRENASDREISPNLLELIRAYMVNKMQLANADPFYLIPETSEDRSEA